MSKLFVLDRNTWYHTTVCKQMIMDKRFKKKKKNSTYNV